MKIILAFDSFKGCITAQQACAAAKDALNSRFPNAEIVSLPMSDGGEGMTDCVAEALNLNRVGVSVTGPLGEKVRAQYAVSPDGTIAYMEAASACGLMYVPEERRNPMLTTTRGVGEMILHAAKHNCRHLVMGLGGSATCDGGKGMVDVILQHLPLDITITVASDVNNPLYGKNGAAYIFGPQKGATPDQVVLLDKQLRDFAKLTESRGYAIAELAESPGAGAAGGLGYAMMAYMGAQLRSGAELVADIVGLKDHSKSADLVITGEGRSDSQTLMGKVPAGVLKIAKANAVPVVLLSGCVENEDFLRAQGFHKVLSINAHDSRPQKELLRPDVAIENLKNSILNLQI